MDNYILNGYLLRPSEIKKRDSLGHEHLSAVTRVLNNKLTAMQELKPLPNTAFPQLKLPEEYIYRLSVIDINAYILYPLSERLSPKIPSGKFTIVVLEDDPLSVYAFSHSEIMSAPGLRAKVAGPINYGHSSLAYIDGGLKYAFDSRLPLHKRAQLSARTALIAGHAYFKNEEHPVIGGGELIYWNNDSGHFKPGVDASRNNRLGIIKKILPFYKFKPIYPG